MKLLRYGPAGQEKPGILDNAGTIRDLSAYLSDLDGNALAPTMLDKLSKLDLAVLPPVRDNVRIGACVAGVSKFICVGLNYSDHAAETGAPVPVEPILFQKATTAIIGPHDDVMLPRN